MTLRILGLAAGRDHSLVLDSDARLLGWGGDGTGRFPPPAGVCVAPPAAGVPVVVRTAPGLRQITASAGTSLGLDERGRAYIWGANRAGIGGRLAHIVHERPQPVPGVPPLAQLSSGEFFTLALARDGSLYGWGLASGQSRAHNAAPARFAGMPRLTACCAGGAHAFALDATHRLWAWGANTAGQLGLGHLQDQTQPVLVPLPSEKWVTVAAGASHSLAIDKKGAAWAWGSNQHGQLGDDGAPYRTRPARAILPEAVVQVAAGLYVSYALGRSGRLYAWGWNARGQLGQGHTLPIRGVQTVDLPAPVTRIAAGQGHALASDGRRVWAWGDNTSAQLGHDGPHDGTPRELNVTQNSESPALEPLA